MQRFNAVVVGADRLGNIPDLLTEHNIRITHHVSGRDASHQRKMLQLPSGTEMVILLTDFLDMFEYLLIIFSRDYLKWFRERAI